MNLFLQIRIVDNQFEFIPPFVLDDVHCFDLDNFSSKEVVHVAEHALGKADKLLLFFQLQNTQIMGSLLNVTAKALKFSGNKQLLYSGENSQISPIILKFGAVRVDELQLLAKAKKFFSVL